ncbi:hypothetical protein LCGC14_0856820 [marine sediment metagenome]|uniref:Uncharacterized protein n=1 Tax=marine sediment metagenome TaxID=412755 RepID=A0A0F9RT62_9ZZZZ
MIWKADKMSKDITLNFEHEFPLCICPHCNHKFVVLGIWEYDNGDDSYDYQPQVNTNESGMYCPYCGKNSMEKLQKHLTREGGLIGATEEYLTLKNK